MLVEESEFTMHRFLVLPAAIASAPVIQHYATTNSNDSCPVGPNSECNCLHINNNRR